MNSNNITDEQKLSNIKFNNNPNRSNSNKKSNESKSRSWKTNMYVTKSLDINEETKPIFMSTMIYPPTSSSPFVNENYELVSRQQLDNKLFETKDPLNICIPDKKEEPMNIPQWDTWYIIHLLPRPKEYLTTRTTFEYILSNGESVETVADTIFTFNKNQSIQAEYNNEDAMAMCKTRFFMKFHICLFQGSDENTIVIEVQRRSGCALEFKKVYQALRQLFQGGGDSAIPQVPMQKLANFKCLDTHDLIPHLPDSAIEESLKLSRKHLSSKMYDARLLALEDLVASTDPESSDVASRACRLILQKFSDILILVLNMICIVNNKEDEDDDDSFERIHCLALTLLRNITVESSKDKGFITTITTATQQQQQSVVVDNEYNIINSLLRDVKMAATFPWNACLAIKCLSIICANSTLKVVESARDSLIEAEKIGKACYRSLEVEAKDALRLLALL